METKEEKQLKLDKRYIRMASIGRKIHTVNAVK